MALGADRTVGGYANPAEQERRRTGSRHAVRELMQKFGYDPIEAMIQIAQSTGTPLDMRADMAKNLAPYMYPKLNAITIQGDEDGGPVRFRDEALLQRVLADPEAVAAAQKLGILAADVEDAAAAPEDPDGGG